ncbi:MAG: imidazole glycerol phosphate synthase subunit HisF [Cyanobacteria bacterium REEB67]|nr:imidazole glycerol phosphate synthase subunit HisF [Cyanobacteria bacterium REEB67]
MSASISNVHLTSGLCKRIIPCLDVAGGRTVKGTKFQNLRDVGDPVELGIEYQRQGADELMFLDISATKEERRTVFDLVNNVAAHLSIPFTVGGGINSLDDVRKLLDSGADKVSINSAAVRRPELISEIATACGSQCCVVAIDAKKCGENKWEVIVRGGTVATSIDAFEWGRRCYELGAGEILLTSFDADGTQEGFDLPMVRAFAEALPIAVIASGGARNPQSFVDVFEQASADAALAASIFHDNLFTIADVKNTLSKAGIQVRI